MSERVERGFKCKKYLYGDMDSKYLFRFRSGTCGLIEEIGRHSSRNTSIFVSVSL